ncbi:hypothetical protein D3C84_1025280 [compost metagenome]
MAQRLPATARVRMSVSIRFGSDAGSRMPAEIWSIRAARPALRTWMPDVLLKAKTPR